MALRRPLTGKKPEDLVKKLPGWKPPPEKAPAEGEELLPKVEEMQRVVSLPEFAISK